MQLTEGQARVLYYVAEGFGAYHLAVTRAERATRDRLIRSMTEYNRATGRIDHWLATDSELTEAGLRRLPEARAIHARLRATIRSAVG